jgi:hypothetical protein
MNGYFGRGVAPGEFPRSERGRVFMHSKFGSRRLTELYAITKSIFHQDAYYEEVIDFKELGYAREAMRNYLDEARSLTERPIADGGQI